MIKVNKVVNSNTPPTNIISKSIKDVTKFVTPIVNGTANLIKNSHTELAKSREEICSRCPLFTGQVCNPKLMINIETGAFKGLDESQLSSNINTGWVRGCGCVLKSKIRTLCGLRNCTCPANKWKNVDNQYIKIKESDKNSLLMSNWDEEKQKEFKKYLDKYGIVWTADHYGLEVEAV